MNKEEFYYLGRIIKEQKNAKEFLSVLDADNPEKYNELDTVFIKINETFIPFFIKKFELKGNQAVIRFEDDPDPDVAELLIGSELYLPIQVLPELEGKKFYYHEITGFLVIDKKKGQIGIIKNVLELPQQAMFQVDHKGREILIPVADDIILEIDKKNKKILVDTPEGLIDIYI